MEEMSKQPTDVQQYMSTYINPFIEPLVYDMVEKRPDSPLHYAIQQLIKLEHRNGYRSNTSCSSDDDEEEDKDVIRDIDYKIAHKKENANYYTNRVGISEEVRKPVSGEALFRSNKVSINEEEK